MTIPWAPVVRSMDGYEFTAAVIASLASIVGSLAWPAAIIVACYYLRKPLTKLLERATKLSFAGAEMRFKKSMDIAAAIAETLPTIKTTADENKDESSPVPPSDQCIDCVSSDSNGTPSVIVIESWHSVSDLLREMARSIGINAPFDEDQLAVILTSRGIIDRGTTELIRQLKEVRDISIHRSDISESDARRYLGLAREVRSRLRSFMEQAASVKGGGSS